ADPGESLPVAGSKPDRLVEGRLQPLESLWVAPPAVGMLHLRPFEVGLFHVGWRDGQGEPKSLQELWLAAIAPDNIGVMFHCRAKGGGHGFWGELVGHRKLLLGKVYRSQLPHDSLK